MSGMYEDACHWRAVPGSVARRALAHTVPVLFGRVAYTVHEQGTVRMKRLVIILLCLALS